MCDPSSIQVALRIRPLVLSEIEKGCRDILEVHEKEKQVRIKGSDKAFTFNHIFSPLSTQSDVCIQCTGPLIENLFAGYNVTILAYGQTGSGKTYSMGTNYSLTERSNEMGVIPSAVYSIFREVVDNFTHEFSFYVSFTELYQEVLYDLLSEKPRNQCSLEIREDSKGLVIQNMTELPVKNAEDVLKLLQTGSSRRATAATNMNAHSSRSHAIFTINITKQNKNDLNDRKTAKFNLVDLAGSERSKKTGAEGITFKEGVNINKGLLVLGNVISALGDEKQAQGYISYRDSNLTRLLKDSLGGNSITLMIACVSPADYNVDETLSTLRYADRAKKIRNKPIVNQDPKAAEIIDLKKTIQQLKLEIIGQGGGVVGCNCQKTIDELRCKLSMCITDNMGNIEKLQILQTANENLNNKILLLKEQYDVTINNISVGFDKNDCESVKQHMEKLQNIKQQFLEIDTEQKKTENELRNHERDLQEQSRKVDNNGANPSEPSLNAEQATFTTKQITMQTELDKISKELAIKELLAQQISSNMKNLIDYSMMTENEEKISTLEREKEQLMVQLKDAQNQPSAGSKLAQQRYKRVQELEHQIQDLKKKIQEQSRLIKIKEKDEQKILKLNNEIQQMKSTKVNLIRRMREDYNNFRDWKLKRERELAKLKQEDRKKQNQIIKMEAMHSKQQNVLKRKVEEAVAINKRLQNTLSIRKQAQELRFNGKIDKMEHWLKNELDHYINVVKAKTLLVGLLEGRATLQNQLKEMVDANPESKESPQYKEIEEDIELRSVQIQELQQKLLDSDDKSKCNWENIQTMVEAKVALKTVWETTGELTKKLVSVETKLNDLQADQSEMADKIKNSEERFKIIEEDYSIKLTDVQKDYEEKIRILLNQLREIEVENKDEELRMRCNIQQETIRRLEEELVKQKESQAVNNLTIPTDFNTFKTPERVPPKVIVKKEPVLLDDEKENHEISFEDDPDKDPDWRKTPLGKRILGEKKKPKQSDLFAKKFTTKRTSNGGCNCSKKCTFRCGCKKMSKACGPECNCSVLECSNRSNETVNDNNSMELDSQAGGDSSAEVTTNTSNNDEERTDEDNLSKNLFTKELRNPGDAKIRRTRYLFSN